MTTARQRMVHAAIPLLLQTGIKGFRVQDFTDAMGCSRQAFYRHFHSKQDLIRAVFVEGGQELAHYVVNNHLSRKQRLDTMIIESILISVELVKESPYSLRLFTEDLPEIAVLAPEVTQAVEDAVYPVIEDFLRSWSPEQILREGIGIRDVIRWVFRVFVAELLYADTSSRAARKRYLEKMLLPSLLKQG